MFPVSAFPPPSFPNDSFPPGSISELGGEAGQTGGPAGYRSYLAYWMGSSAQIQGGYHGHLAYWLGGAKAGIPVDAGYRSLQAFWIGGATAGQTLPSGPQPGGGDSREEWLRLRGQIIREDSEFVELLAALFENDIIH